MSKFSKFQQACSTYYPYQIYMFPYWFNEEDIERAKEKYDEEVSVSIMHSNDRNGLTHTIKSAYISSPWRFAVVCICHQQIKYNHEKMDCMSVVFSSAADLRYGPANKCKQQTHAR